tara:strand:- start:11236 stop:12180 length:945 start_codon:yes stop_codon:yes gene_type:complete
MAIDTSDKRKSALQYQSPSIFALPTSDSSIVELDRRQIAKVYRSLLYLIPAAVESESEASASALIGSLAISPTSATSESAAVATVATSSVAITPSVATSETAAVATAIAGSIAVSSLAAEVEHDASATVSTAASETVTPASATSEASLSATVTVTEETITTATSVYKQALERFAAQLSDLDETSAFFSGTPDVQVRKFDWDDIVKQNGVSVRYQRDSVQSGAGNNSTDFWGYPLHVVIVQERQMQISDEPQLLLSKIRRTYNHTQKLGVPLTGVCSSATVVRNGPRVPQDKRTQNAFRDKDIYTMTVVAWFDEQ